MVSPANGPKPVRHHADSTVIQMVLDDALGRVKPSSFAVLYSIAKVAQKSPGKPITMLQITRTSGVGERTCQGALKELSKALILDLVDTPQGYLVDFIPPFLPAEPDSGPNRDPQVGGGASFSGVSRYISSLDLVNEEVGSSTSLEYLDLGDIQITPENLAHRRPGRRGIFEPGLVKDLVDLAELFESLVQPNVKNRLTPQRRAKWYPGLHYLVAIRKAPVQEITEVFEWLFSTWHGMLPFPVTYGDRKITRVSQVSWRYNEVLRAMGRAA